MRPPRNPINARDFSGADPSRPSLDSGLYVVSTPIGNLKDITLRALDVLAGAALVLAEDTRNTRKLLTAHGISPAALEACHDHNEAALAPRVVETLQAGRAVALVSDAGTPLVSDPGYRLIQAVIAAGLRVIPVPGASALLSALVASGLPTDRFLFAGFLPAKAGPRADVLGALAATPATLVFYETGPRLADSLAAMRATLGDRRAAIGRELTKLFEEVRRGRLSELEAAYAAPPKGEIVVIVSPPDEEAVPDEAVLDAALRRFLADLSVKEAAQRAALETGVSRKIAYARALALKATP